VGPQPRGASVLQETGKFFAGLGVNRRIDSIKRVLTPPLGHGRIFDAFLLAADHLM
jgi:hypothetical protein